MGGRWRLTLHRDDDLMYGHGVFLHPALVGASVGDLQVGQADGGVVLAGVVLHEGHPVLQPRAAAVVDVVVMVGQELGGASGKTGQDWSGWGDRRLPAAEGNALPVPARLRLSCLVLPSPALPDLPGSACSTWNFPCPARPCLPCLALPARLGSVWSIPALPVQRGGSWRDK